MQKVSLYHHHKGISANNRIKNDNRVLQHTQRVCLISLSTFLYQVQGFKKENCEIMVSFPRKHVLSFLPHEEKSENQLRQSPKYHWPLPFWFFRLMNCADQWDSITVFCRLEIHEGLRLQTDEFLMYNFSFNVQHSDMFFYFGTEMCHWSTILCRWNYSRDATITKNTSTQYSTS